MDNATTARIVDGISSFRQINGCWNICGVRVAYASGNQNSDFIRGKRTGRAYGVTRTPYSGKSSNVHRFNTRHKKEWASGRITVNRPIGIREPSVICQGIHGNITGMRADLIICDDVEVPNTSNTAQKRENLRERLRELDFILSPDGAMIYIGTPHTLDSIYRTHDNQ